MRRAVDTSKYSLYHRHSTDSILFNMDDLSKLHVMLVIKVEHYPPTKLSTRKLVYYQGTKL